MRRLGLELTRSESGAVAPTVALSLFALLACGGIAFDYSRLVTLDSELQHAADQAALAAAGQLDGQTGARARATAAAQSLFNNETLFANDSNASGINVTVPTVLFYASKADAEAENGNDCPGNNIAATSTTGDKDAKYVCVRTADRVAKYALTPVVAAISSPNVSSMAVAGMGSSICKVPPLMMCNPQETSTTTTFNVSAYRGKGIRLVEGGNGAAWAPGNFGYLQTGLGPGANVLEYALGANNPPGDCLASDGVTTKPGENTSVTDAVNTRFDIYENGLVNSCTGSTCSPSPNVRKDVIRAVGSTNYGYNTGNDPWELPPIQYLPDSSGVQLSPYPNSMGHPRDICHSISEDGNCASGRIGDGAWDRALYFYVNHRGLYPTAPTTPDATWKNIPSLVTYATTKGITLDNITRWEVYNWELAQDATENTLAALDSHSTTKGANTTLYKNYGRPVAGTSLPAGPTQLDRRLTSIAVINCLAEDLKGQGKGVAVVNWVEVFLVEPSLARPRTKAGDIYVEVVRVTTSGGSAPTNPQVVRRDVPYLIK